jgi:hypothetical protein
MKNDFFFLFFGELPDTVAISGLNFDLVISNDLKQSGTVAS